MVYAYILAQCSIAVYPIATKLSRTNSRRRTAATEVTIYFCKDTNAWMELVKSFMALEVQHSWHVVQTSWHERCRGGGTIKNGQRVRVYPAAVL
jgi:hypothetical protein